MNNPFGNTSSGASITFPDVGGATMSNYDVPSGEWPMKVLSFEQTKTGTGKDQFEIKFSITANGVEYKLTKWQVITPATMPRVANIMKALGIKAGASNPNKLVGNKCMGKVIRGINHKGEERSEIDTFSPMPSDSAAVDEDNIPF